MFFHLIPHAVKVSDQRDCCADTVRETLDDIDVEEVSWIDDPNDPEAIEIIITGRFKEDAFKRYLDEDLDAPTPRDKFDDAKPF